MNSDSVTILIQVQSICQLFNITCSVLCACDKDEQTFCLSELLALKAIHINGTQDDICNTQPQWYSSMLQIMGHFILCYLTFL